MYPKAATMNSLDSGDDARAFILRPGSETATAREKLERILAYMLMKDYIKEEFHFTPYSTISYLHAGSQANKLREKRTKTYLEMPVKAKTAVTVDHALTSRLEKQISSSSKTLSQKTLEPKPKLVIVNDTNSAFTDLHKPTTPLITDQERLADSSRGSNSHILKRDKSLILKKRKSGVIYDSESESDSLDFGSENRNKGKKPKNSKSVPVKKSKKHVTKSSSDPIEKSSVVPVLIDSDSDVDMELNGDLNGDGDLKDLDCVNGDNVVSSLTKGSNSWTEEDKAAAVCLLDSDSDFE